MEERFNGRLFALQVWGTYIWRGLQMEGLFSEFYGIDVTSSEPREIHKTCAPFANLVE